MAFVANLCQKLRLGFGIGHSIGTVSVGRIRIHQLDRAGQRCARTFSDGRDDKKPIKVPREDEYKGQWEVLMNDFAQNPRFRADVPSQTDILIVGGGIMGLATAYWLKQRSPDGISVTVIERDPMYCRASTVLSFGGLRTQFSIPENVQMSLFCSQFIREIKEHLSVIDMDPPDVQFQPNGYLILANRDEADNLIQSNKMQNEVGAHTILLSQAKMKERWPWLNVDDVELGSFGVENEGWFDPWSFLMAFKHKARSLGVNIIEGKVTSVDLATDYRLDENGDREEIKRLEYVNVLTPDNYLRPIKMAYCLNAAGCWAGEFAEMLGIGKGDDVILGTPLPIEKRKRYVYVVHAPNGPGINSPMVVDSTGTCVRREGLGGMYLVYGSPGEEHEPECSDLEVDHDFFDCKLWPEVAHRAPCFQKLKVVNSWAGYYDYNYVDQNLIIGQHPYFRNLLFANGSSGHGLQHACAVGRAIQELIVDGKYTNIDLARFDFKRILLDQPYAENYVI